jgi:hypothetical protein
MTNTHSSIRTGIGTRPRLAPRSLEQIYSLPANALPT